MLVDELRSVVEVVDVDGFVHRLKNKSGTPGVKNKGGRQQTRSAVPQSMKHVSRDLHRR